MKVLLFAAFVFAVITLTTGASVRESNEKHSVKQRASRRIGNRLQNPGPDNIRPDVDSDERVLESDLEEYEDDEWPDSQHGTVESEELELEEVSRSKYSEARRKAKKARAMRSKYRKAKRAAKRVKAAKRAAKRAAKKAAKKAAKRIAKKAKKKIPKKAKRAAKKAAKAARKRLRSKRRRRYRRHPRRYPPRTAPPRRTRPTRPPSKGPKYCPCRMVAKPAKECYSYTNAEKGYCKLRNCDAKWECLTSGRSKHICMQKFAVQKIIPAHNYGKYTKCRTVRHRKKPFYVLYRTIRPHPRPRPTRPSRYTRSRPRYPKKYPKRESKRRRVRKTRKAKY